MPSPLDEHRLTEKLRALALEPAHLDGDENRYNPEGLTTFERGRLKELLSWVMEGITAQSGNAGVDKIQKTVCRHYGITLTEMLNGGKPARVSMPRMLSMYLCEKFLGLARQENACFHKREDHNTVRNAVKKSETCWKPTRHFAKSTARSGRIWRLREWEKKLRPSRRNSR
jgi:hypothetical protein